MMNKNFDDVILESVQKAYFEYLESLGIDDKEQLSYMQARKHTSGDSFQDYLVIDTHECTIEFNTNSEKIEGLRTYLSTSAEALQAIVESLNGIDIPEDTD